MENDQSKQKKTDTPAELSKRPSYIDTDDRAKRTQKGNNQAKEAKQSKKWTLRRHWDQATLIKRTEWVGGTILGLFALIYYGTQIGQSIWNAIESERHYSEEHRPKVILSGPPDLIDTFTCQVTENAIHLYTGTMRIGVKNTSEHDAIGAFIAGPEFKLVPNQKIGESFYDDIPSITDNSCNFRPKPQMRLFPVHGREEVAVDLRQSAGVMTLIKTKSASVTFGGPQQEPQPPPGETPSKRVPFDKDTLFQFYGPTCVYYSSYDAKAYGSCRTYRLMIDGRPESSDQFSFSCSQTPIRGHFEAAFSNYCEN